MKMTAHKKGETQSVHWCMDEQGRIYAIVTSTTYPVRVAFAALDEFQTSFNRECGFRVPSATENSLSKAAKNSMKAIIDKYAEPSKADVITSVQVRIHCRFIFYISRIMHMLIFCILLV